MVLRHSLLRADIAEDIQLLLVFSAHAFFLSGCAVETREFSGTASASLRQCRQTVRRAGPSYPRSKNSFQERHRWAFLAATDIAERKFQAAKVCDRFAFQFRRLELP